MLNIKSTCIDLDFCEELEELNDKSAELVSGGVHGGDSHTSGGKDYDKGQWRICESKYFITKDHKYYYFYEEGKKECKTVSWKNLPSSIKSEYPA